jgi:hypothetical protein
MVSSGRNHPPPPPALLPPLLLLLAPPAGPLLPAAPPGAAPAPDAVTSGDPDLIAACAAAVGEPGGGPVAPLAAGLGGAAAAAAKGRSRGVLGFEEGPVGVSTASGRRSGSKRGGGVHCSASCCLMQQISCIPDSAAATSRCAPRARAPDLCMVIWCCRAEGLKEAPKHLATAVQSTKRQLRRRHSVL